MNSSSTLLPWGPSALGNSPHRNPQALPYLLQASDQYPFVREKYLTTPSKTKPHSPLVLQSTHYHFLLRSSPITAHWKDKPLSCSCYAPSIQNSAKHAADAQCTLRDWMDGQMNAKPVSFRHFTLPLIEIQVQVYCLQGHLLQGQVLLL